MFFSTSVQKILTFSFRYRKRPTNREAFVPPLTTTSLRVYLLTGLIAWSQTGEKYMCTEQKNYVTILVPVVEGLVTTAIFWCLPLYRRDWRLKMLNRTTVGPPADGAIEQDTDIKWTPEPVQDLVRFHFGPICKPFL